MRSADYLEFCLNNLTQKDQHDNAFIWFTDLTTYIVLVSYYVYMI